MTIKELEAKFPEISPETTDSFIRDIRTCVVSGSVATLQLLSLLGRIIGVFRPKAQAICDSKLPADENSVREVFQHAKILCVQMLILQNTHSYRELSEKMLLFLEWVACLCQSGKNLAALAVKCLSRQCTSTGLTWEVITSAMSLEFLAYHVENKSVFSGAESAPLSYTGKGSVSIENGSVYVLSGMSRTGGAKAWEECGSSLQVYSRNTRDEKLKASYLNNAGQLAAFAKNFTASQNCAATFRTHVNRQVQVGDKVALRCERINSSGQPPLLYVTALRTTLEGRGYVRNEELLRGIWTEDLLHYIYEEDCIRGATVQSTGGTLEFSIRDCYRQFAKQAAEEDYRNGTIFEAAAIYIDTKHNRINWITAGGYGAVSFLIDGVKAGDRMVMNVLNIQTSGGEIYINIEQPKHGSDRAVRVLNDEQVLSSFLSTEEDVLKELDEQAGMKPEEKLAKESALRSLSRIVFNSRCPISIERYRMMLTSLFISNCIGDEAGVRLAEEETAYFGTLLCYAQNTPQRTKQLPDLGPERNYIINCLSIHQSGDLNAVIPLLSSNVGNTKIASLIAAQFISNEFSDDVKTDSDSIRRRICAILEVGDCFVESGAPATGKYGSTENRNLEFKSSYVFRNDNGEPDLIHQGRDQVFEAVCGFLNSDGGTVYVGVNNSGDPILSGNSGISGDISWFRANFYNSVLPRRMSQLRHGTSFPDTLDHYALFLSQEKELYFKDSILDKITIEPTEDEDAIRIIVKPSLYEIAYLYEDETHTKGTAYVRNAGSTLPMTEKQKQERLMNQKRISKEVQFAVILQQACDLQHKVILKGYHSGSSGEIRDRLVVPVNLFNNDENVLCFDLDSRSEKQFRLSRITAIETDIPNPDYPHCFRKKTADVFRWIGSGNYHLKARLEVGAYNFLIEEYSMAKKLPASELYKEEGGCWILDTHLQALDAFRRFYLGLADKIEILETEDSEEIRNNVRKYVEENLSAL